MTVDLDEFTYREVMLEDTKRRLTEAVSSLIAIYEAHGFALELPCLIGLRGKVEKYKREINECLDEI